MTTYKKTSYILLALLASPVLSAENLKTITSAGIQYEFVDNTQYLNKSINVSGVYAGQKVINRSLGIEGEVTRNIIIKTSAMKNLSFHEKNMEKIHIVNGYWMLKFPSDTDLMKKLEWINEQDDIIKAEIEIMNNMNQPR